LTEEEQEEYVSNSITRDKKIRFELEMGKQIYAFGILLSDSASKL